MSAKYLCAPTVERSRIDGTLDRVATKSGPSKSRRLIVTLITLICRLFETGDSISHHVLMDLLMSFLRQARRPIITV